ncbi:MAG: hypothetical protein HY827_07545 [Actinobacteria bacterium]|nr:hypothetical protein [Actinomycetota bacterium]
MNFALGSRTFLTLGKTVLIAMLAVLIAFSSTEARAASSVGTTGCDAAITKLNSSLVTIAKRRIAVRVAKTKGTKALKRAKRALKKAQNQGMKDRAEIAKQCAGGNGINTLDAECTMSIDKLSKSIDLRYARVLRYKKLKVKGSKKARAKALKRKRAMKTQLKKLDEQIKWQGEQFHKSCGGNNRGSDGGTGTGGNNNGNGNGGNNNNGNGNGNGGNNGNNTDTTPPGAVVIVGPEGPTSDNTPTIEVIAPETGGTIQCRIDGDDWQTVTSPWTTPELTDGDHTITCRYVDAAGNVGPDTSITITIDTTAPGAVTITGPGGPTSDNTPTIDLSGGDGTGHYECKINDGAYETVTAPYTLPALPDGTYTITCRYVDGAGNPGPETSITITIDTTAPGAVTITGPSGLTNDNTPTIDLSGAGAGEHYECKIDGGDYETVGASYTTPALSDGIHTITCRIVDEAGNAGPESSSNITVDTVGPVVTVADGTPKWDGTHSFSLSSSEPGVTYQCKIDGGAYATVAASFTTAALSNGTHTIACRATDAAGNTGATATKDFGVFKDPTTLTKSGGFQWGLGCTYASSLNQLLGCPDVALTLTIPANPNGLTGNYLADVSGYINRINSLFGTYTKYTMSITVDGVAVATDDATIWFNLCGLSPVDLSASKTNLSLLAATSHTITIRLKTSVAIDLLPSVKSSGLTVSIHH